MSLVLLGVGVAGSFLDNGSSSTVVTLRNPSGLKAR